jgi:hypothetical protein
MAAKDDASQAFPLGPVCKPVELLRGPDAPHLHTTVLAAVYGFVEAVLRIAEAIGVSIGEELFYLGVRLPPAAPPGMSITPLKSDLQPAY